MPTALSHFFEALTNEENRLAGQVRSDRLGLTMRTALNELDLDDYLTGNKPDATDRDRERLYLMRIGVARLVKIALDAHPSFDAPTLTFRRSLKVSLPLLHLVEELAIVEHGRRIAQSVAAGIASIDRNGDEFAVTLPATLPDFEIAERALAKAYRDESRRAMAERLRSPLGRELGEGVSKLFDELVYPYAEHFIGYDAHPTLDIAFFGLAYHEITLSDEYDNFHFATRFGGITFQNWKLAATFILSVAMRHERFAEALVAKKPSTRIEDVLTVSVNTPSFVEGLRDAINYFGSRFKGHARVTLADAYRIFEVLSISRRNTKLLDRPGAPFPPLIQCSDQHVIRPLFGAKEGLMLFILTSLQYHFPTDYDRAQRQRERAMQLAAKRVLGQAFPTLEFRDNIRIRTKGQTTTDIDLAVIEPGSGKVLLFQLKHQDPYGADLAAMKERTSRLKQQTEKWLAAVTTWLVGIDRQNLRSTLRIPKNSPEPMVKMVVLTRHFAHSLRDLVSNSEIYCANWNQFVHAAHLMSEKTGKEVGLDDFLTSLKSITVPDHQEEFLPEPRSEWKVGNLAFSIVQSPH